MVIPVNPDGSPVDIGPQIKALEQQIKDMEAAGADPHKWFNPITKKVVDLYADLERLRPIGDLHT